jgi:hypothetical protein
METIKWNSEEEKQVIGLDKKSKRIERSTKRRNKRLSKDELFEKKWK